MPNSPSSYEAMMPTKQYSPPKQKEERQSLEEYKWMKESLTNIGPSQMSSATKNPRGIPQRGPRITKSS